MKWFKRIVIASFVLLLLLAGFVFTGHMLSRRAPGWYPTKALSPEEMKQAARSMENKFLDFQGWAADVNQAERTRASDRAPVATDPTTAPARTRTIALTEAEMNAFFSRWDDKMNLEDKYNQYVTEPVLVLQDDRIILAGRVPDAANRIVSVHLDPKLDAQGKLRLDIADVMAGSLSVPRAFYDTYRTKLGRVLTAKIDRERKNVKLNSDGSANLPLVTASMNELLLHAINGEPAEPILFLPHDALHPQNGLPVKLTDIKVKDKTITFTVVPLTPDERQELVRRVRTPAGQPAPGLATAR